MNFYTADWHLFHNNIIHMKDLHRKFTSMSHMENTIKKNINEVVKKEDHLYIIGDLAWLRPDQKMRLHPILEKINGIKHLILGNHDELNPFDYENAGITSIHTSLIVNDRILCHDPAKSCVDRTRTWLVGHVHTLFTVQKNCINVGVDVWDFKPLSEIKIEEVEKFLPRTI